MPRTATACGANWRTVDSPNGSWNNILGGVASVSPTDIWAVGNSQDPVTGDRRNLAEHWNGVDWVTVPVPAATEATDDVLDDVAAISASDIWASGVAFDPVTKTSYPTAFHWDGSAWTERYSALALTNAGFNQVAVSGPNDVWFAGWWTYGSADRALVVHWDGSTWSPFYLSPGGINQSSILVSVKALTSTDVWAVGYQYGTTPTWTVMEHWNGVSWTAYSLNTANPVNELFHVSASSSTDVLAVGFVNSGTLRTPLALHWNGSAWSAMPVPNMGSGDSVLEGLTQLSATDAWAVGYWRPTSAGPLQPFAEHWNGTIWIAVPGAATGSSLFFSAAEPAAGDLWAVGTFLIAGGINQNLVNNYTGLAPPTAVTATAGNQSAAVSWSAPCGDGGSPITSYVVTAHDGCTVQGSVNVTAPATTTTFSGLTNGNSYTFTVAAINGFGVGPPSATPSPPVKPSGATGHNVSACSTRQYSLAASDGATWQAMDAINLAVSFTPAADSYAVLSGNVDLWTADAGFNQDVGIAVTGPAYPTTLGQPEAWKESGGFAGTASPNAAFVQRVIPVLASQTYTATLVWKANKPDPGTIFAGAGPLGGVYSPTRLTVQLVPSSPQTVFSRTSTQQFSRPFSGAADASWLDVDSTNLSVPFTVPNSGSWIALVSGNADLWTSSPGYNQDFGVTLFGTDYPQSGNGNPQAWKESGGFAGTFSPNAAFVEATFAVVAGPHTARLQWKTNIQDPHPIFAGAGPIGGRYSPTTVTVVLMPVDPATFGAQANYSVVQFAQPNSDGAAWVAFQRGQLTGPVQVIAPTADSDYAVSVNSDLWTSVAGYNQDLGIMVSGGAYGDQGTLVAWKESGGFAGTFSPNAAFVTAVLHLQGGSTYKVWPVWKANRLSQIFTVIWAGAGPLDQAYSPTWLTAELLS